MVTTLGEYLGGIQKRKFLWDLFICLPMSVGPCDDAESQCLEDSARGVTSSWDHLDIAMIRASSVLGDKLSADPMAIC